MINFNSPAEMPDYGIKKIIPYEILDSFKSNWYLWKCKVELNCGKIQNGSVEADYLGELIAKETLEID